MACEYRWRVHRMGQRHRPKVCSNSRCRRHIYATLSHAQYTELRLPDVVTAGVNSDVGELIMTPFTGITLLVEVQPSWLPTAERYGYASIERVGGGFAQRDLLVRHQQAITVDGVPLTILVRVTRPGFAAVR